MKRFILVFQIVCCLMIGIAERSANGQVNSSNKNLGFISEKNRPAKKYSWETAQAKAVETGDLIWMPRLFVFESGKSVRYIDYEGGNDANSGLSWSDPWKHHPWDRAAEGNSLKCKGIHTFVFKRGSVYRGAITVQESGVEGNPVRFTSDPSWGAGEAFFYGSARVTGGWTKGADHKDIPNADNVWYRDLDFAPRTLWMVDGDKITRIPIARMPNWKITDLEDIKSEWWTWDYKDSSPFNVFMTNESGKELILGIDSKNITGPRELYMGAIVWAEFAWVDGTPYPAFVEGFDAAKKGIGFEGYLGNPRSRIIARNQRYYLEDKPHYLDDPAGEFWFDKKGTGGRLYVILPYGKNPNNVVLEAGKETTLIDIEDKEHIVISGLSFKYTNIYWNLTETPWAEKMALKKHIHPACVRVWGSGKEIHVSNCSFSHVNAGVFLKAVRPGAEIDKVSVTDCEICETDHTAISIEDGILWGNDLPEDAGHLFDAKILRNYIYKAGQRAQRIGSANATNVDSGTTIEVGGNIIDMPWHAGVNVHGGKRGNNLGDVPLSRILIYQNRVVDGIRTGDDCGNIETWQGGAAYVYNNVSGNPGGLRYVNWISGKDNPNNPGSARFGMAYYLDGAFKNYYFNNIGWGLNKDPWSFVGATTMFQEIISYNNTFFNNTAYNFVKGTRRQSPHAGRNKFLGNIWDGIGDWVFWHTVPARSIAAGNEQDAGPQKMHYALETNAFTGNIFHDITGKYASFKPSGQWHESFDDARKALEETGAIASDLGVEASSPPMINPAKRDFRLAEGSAAIDRGVKVFVPWNLYAPVGEWHFYHTGNDPSIILDENWYMTPYYVDRTEYYRKPRFDLKVVNVGKDDYKEGPLEDWTKGTLRFNGINRYAVCADTALSKSFDYTVRFRWNRTGTETRHVTGKDFKSPQVYDSNFLLEVVFEASKEGVLIEKMADAGYSLGIDRRGKISFTVKGGGKTANLVGKTTVNDGAWHHVIAEVDRASNVMTIYIDGKKDASGACIGNNASIDNPGDLYVGGTPSGRCFKGALEFMRICLGTLADAKTDIDELYTWQFYGPFLKDFTGKDPIGKRDAGALER